MFADFDHVSATAKWLLRAGPDGEEAHCAVKARFSSREEEGASRERSTCYGCDCL